MDLTENLIPVTGPNVSAVSVPFHPFQPNELPMDVRIRNVAEIPTGVLAFTKRPRSSADERPPTPVCLLRATLPDSVWTPTLRKGREQGAAGDVEYVPPDAEKPTKLEWPSPDDEPPDVVLPFQAAYASKEIAKKPSPEPTVEGDIKTRREVTEEQQALSDGSTIKRQIAVVTSFRPVTEFPSRDNSLKEPKVHEKIVRVDVEENSVHLPPGVVEPYGSNVVAKVSTDKYEDVLPNGAPRSKTVTVFTVKLKPGSGEMVPVDIEPELEKRPVHQQLPKSALQRMEDLLKSDEDDTSPPFSGTADVPLTPVVLAEGGPGKPRVSRRFGAVSSKTEVSEDEQTLNDGTTVKWKTTTTRHAAPVFEVSELDGRSSERPVGEKLIRTDIQEVVVRMAPGVLYPYGSNVESETTEAHFEDTLPDGSLVKKNIINIDVRNVPPDEKGTEDTLVDGTPVITDASPLDTGSRMYSPDRKGTTKPQQPQVTPLLSKDEGPQFKGVIPSDRPVDSSKLPAQVARDGRIPTDVGMPMKPAHLQDASRITAANLLTPIDGSTGPTVVPGAGTAIPRKTTKEYRRGLNNGDILIQKVTTTQRLQPAAAGDTGAGQAPSPKVVGTEIEENVLKLPAGTIEPGGNNVQCDINVVKTEGQTPDGTPIRKKTVTANVNFKTPMPSGSPKPSRIVKGDIQSRLKTTEDRHNLDDGTLVAEKTTETDYFKPVVEVRSVDGKEVRLPLSEEPVKVETLRNVLELHPGVIEPYGSNVTTDVTVDNFDEKLPNGVPVKRKVVKLVVVPDKKEATSPGDESKQPVGSELQTPGIPAGTKAIPSAVTSRGDIAGKTGEPDERAPVSQTGIPGERIRPTDGEVRGLPTDVAPSAQKKIIEGPIKSKTDVSEDERHLPNGGTLKHKAVTVTHVKPIEEVTIINGRPAGSTLREEVVDKEIDDRYTELPAGVISAYGPDVESETTVDHLDDEVVDGVLVKRTVRRTKVHRKPVVTTPSLRDLLHEIENTVADTETAAVNKINELLSPTEPTAEGKILDGVPAKPPPSADGDIRSRTSVLEFQRCLDDGTTIRRIVAVTQRYVPVAESPAAARVAGRSPLRRGERLVDVEIDENLLALPPGVAEPNGDNCDTTISIQKSERTLADGTPVRKTAATTIVTFKPPKTRIVEGDVQLRSNVEQDQKCLPDGSTIRRKIINTRKIRPVSEVTVRDGKEVVKFLREKVVGATIEENILELPPGVIEPSGTNCDTDITVTQLDDALADGTPAERKIVRMVVRIRDQPKPEKLPMDDRPASEPVRTTEVEGPIRSETETKQYEENLEDGTTIVRKVIITKHIKSVTEQRSPRPDAPSEPVTREKVDSVDIEENILQLPPGVIEPFAKNCDNDISVDHSEQTSLDGVVVRRKVVKMTVRLKQPEAKPPTTKTVEGEAVVRVDVSESEKVLDNGTKSLTKRVTKKHVRPVTDVTIVDGVPTVTNYREVTLDASIDEAVRELGPGVIEPRETDNVKATTKVERTHETLPEGIRAAKTVTITSYCLKEPEAKPPTTKTVEGEAVERVDVSESEKVLDDGTKSLTKRVTKKHVRPVTDVTIVDGVPTVTNYREVTLDASIDETVRELGPGVIEPRETDNVKATTKVERTQETFPDGTRAAKTVTTTTYRRTAEPQITQKFIEGPVEARTHVTEDSKGLDDGTVVKRHVETTTFVKPVRVITRTDGVVTDSSVREETVSTEVNEHVTEMLPGVVEPFGDDVQTRSSEQYFQETMPNGSPLKRKVVKVTASLRSPGKPQTDGVERKVRRIGLAGEMIEDTITEEETLRSPGSSRRSSVSDDGEPVSPTDGPSPAGSEVDLRRFGVYADVVETEPQVEKDVQEYEETLPDSTVVRKRIVTTVEKKTVVMRALLPEDETGAAEPPVQRYVDVSEEEPQVITDVYDTAETLPDGELAKKRVKTTGQRRLTTERKLISGHLDDDQFSEQLQSAERQTGNNSALLQSSLPIYFVIYKRHNLDHVSSD